MAMLADEAMQPTGAEQQPEDPAAPTCNGKPEHVDWETWWLRSASKKRMSAPRGCMAI